MNNNFPQLKICGNNQSSGGYNDIYVINGASFDIPNKSPQGMASQPYYFIVKVTEFNTQYVLVHNKAKSFSALRMGVLKLGISIPRDYRLANGASPYDVLMEVYNAMLQHNMTQSPADPDEYIYNETMCDQMVFTSILQRYSFVSCKCAHRPMIGNDTALLVTDKMREFMLDPHYPELQGYGEIIVARGGDFPTIVTVTEIPRRPIYQLTINGKSAPWSCDPYKQAVTVTLPASEAQFYTPATPIVFQLSALLETGVTPPGVTINHNTETIECTLNCTPLTKVLHFDVEGADRSLVQSLSVKVGGTLKTPDANGDVTLRGEEIVRSVEAVTSTASQYKVKEFGKTLNGYKVTLQAQTQARPVVHGGGAPVRVPVRESFFRRNLLAFILAPAMFVLGLGLGLLFGSGKADILNGGETEPAPQPDNLETIEKLHGRLSQEDVTFDEVRQLYSLIGQYRSTLSAELVARGENYYKVVNYIDTAFREVVNDTEELRTRVYRLAELLHDEIDDDGIVTAANHTWFIDSIHTALCRSTYSVDDTIHWQRFNQNVSGKKINSFKDIVETAKAVGTAAQEGDETSKAEAADNDAPEANSEGAASSEKSELKDEAIAKDNGEAQEKPAEEPKKEAGEKQQEQSQAKE